MLGGMHQFRDALGALRPENPVQRDRALEPHRRIDDVDLVERIGQILALAHEIDRLPHRPERRHGDELRLHAPAGGVFR